MPVLCDASGVLVVDPDGTAIGTDDSGIDPNCQWVVLRDCAEVAVDLAIPYCLAFEANGDAVSYWEIEGVCYSANPGVDLVVETDLDPGVTKVCDPTPTETPCACYYLQARDPCNGNAVMDVGIRVADASGVASDTYVKKDGVCYKFLASDAATTTVPGTVLTGYTVTTSSDPLCCPPPTCNPLPTGLNASYTVTATVHPMQGGDGQPCGYRCGPSVVNISVSSAAVNPTSWESTSVTELCTFPGNPEPEHSGRITVSFIRVPDGFGGYSSCYWQLVWEGDFVGCSMTFRKYTGNTPEGNYYVYRSNSTAVTEADQLDYDCATDGRTRCAMQVDGIQFVSVG